MKKIRSKYQIPVSRYQSGSSLVEVIISLFMIAVLLVLYASSLNSVAMTRKLRSENIAYHIATKQMETLRNTTYETLPETGTITDPLLAEIPSGAGSFTSAEFSGHAGLKEIVVTVSWNDPIAKQVVLKTLSGTGGINPMEP